MSLKNSPVYHQRMNDIQANQPYVILRKIWQNISQVKIKDLYFYEKTLKKTK